MPAPNPPSSEPTPCRCRKHSAGAFIAHGEHTFTRESDEAESLNDMYEMWRWRCGCGGRGHWTAASDSAAYHGWLRHVGVGG